MKKRNKILIVMLSIIAILLFVVLGFIIKTKCFATEYAKLSHTDQKMLSEYNQLFEQIKNDELWVDFDLADKPILAVSKDSLDAYLINSHEFNENLFSKKIDMPKEFALKSVYRVAPIVPQILKIRLDIGSKFNTIGTKYPVFGNDVYFVKYDENESFEAPNTSSHFAPFLAHESFHYYMQNNWELPKRPETELSSSDIDLIKEEYQILDNINTELHAAKNHDTLLAYAKQYADIMEKRMATNKEYVLAESSMETAEGSAQYLTIKTSKLIGYDYGIMYFDNVKNVPLSDILNQIDVGNFPVSYLYSQMTYQTGALLCQLFDELNIPNWQETLNSQTLEHPIYLYDILKEYLTK